VNYLVDMNKTVNFTLFWGFMQLICTRM